MIHQQAVMLAVVQRLVATQILEIRVVTPMQGVPELLQQPIQSNRVTLSGESLIHLASVCHS